MPNKRLLTRMRPRRFSKRSISLPRWTLPVRVFITGLSHVESWQVNRDFLGSLSFRFTRRWFLSPSPPVSTCQTLSTIRAQSLQLFHWRQLAIHDHFDPEVVLHSPTPIEFRHQPSYIWRGLAFEFKPADMYSYHTDMVLDDHTDLLDRRCQFGYNQTLIKNSVHRKIIDRPWTILVSPSLCPIYYIWMMTFFDRYSHTILVAFLTKCVKKHR